MLKTMFVNRKLIDIFLITLPLVFIVKISFSSLAVADESVLNTVMKEKLIKVGIRTDNPPHSFIDKTGKWVGFDVDIANALAKQMGVKIKQVAVDELTRISYLKSGKINIAIASMSHTYKRDKEIDFSQTYFTSIQTFIVKNKSSISSLNELAGKKIGVSRGSHAIGNWKSWLKKNNYPENSAIIIEFGSKQAGIEAVRSGLIAGYAEDYEVLASFSKVNKSLRVLDSAIGMKQDGIGVRENDSKIRDSINFSLQSIKKSGEYNKIYNKWFGENSPTPIPLMTNLEVWPNG